MRSNVQGESVFDGEEIGNGAGDGKSVASSDGKNDAVGPKKTDQLPGLQADAGAAVAENEEPAAGNQETEAAQSNGWAKLGWTPI